MQCCDHRLGRSWPGQKSANVDFVQEVFATAEAVERFIPDTDAVIELGGEDAKDHLLSAAPWRSG